MSDDSDSATKILELSRLVGEMTARIKKKADKVKVSKADMDKLVEYWAGLYYDHVGLKPAFTSRTFKAARDLLVIVGLEESISAVSKAWTDRFFCSKQRDLWHIVNNINTYREQSRPEPKLVVMPAQVMPWDDVANAHVDAAESIEEMNLKLGV